MMMMRKPTVCMCLIAAGLALAASPVSAQSALTLAKLDALEHRLIKLEQKGAADAPQEGATFDLSDIEGGLAALRTDLRGLASEVDSLKNEVGAMDDIQVSIDNLARILTRIENGLAREEGRPEPEPVEKGHEKEHGRDPGQEHAEEHAEEQIDHGPEHAEEHVDHGGPGPHFIDAFYVENAFLAKKIRPDVAFQTGSRGDVTTGSVEIEWSFLNKFSLVAHAPFHRMDDGHGNVDSGVGDMGVGAKFTLVNRPSSFILSAGAKLEIPTGNDEKHLGHGYAAMEPFVFAWLPFGPEKRFSLQTAALLLMPFEDHAHRKAELAAALTWTSPLGLTPVVEGITEFDPADVDPSWWVAPGFRLPVAPGWEIGASYRIPLSGPESHEEDYRFLFGLVRVIELPH